VHAIQTLWTRISHKAGKEHGEAVSPPLTNLASFDELLEFHADRLPNIRVIRKRIYHFGCVVIRGFLPVQRVLEYRALTERCYASCAGLIKILQIDEDTPVDDIKDAGLREFVRNIRIGQIWPEWFEPLTSGRSMYDLLGAEQRRFIRSLFGSEWFKGAGHIRRVSPLSTQQSKTWQEPICMHCDGPVLSRHTYSINIWVPLDDCGADAPGLQLVPDAFKERQEAVRHDLETSYVDMELELAVQRHYSSELDGKPRFRPRLARGDVVMFHNWVMHGTFSRPEMTNPRTSFELRFNAPRRRDFEQFAR